MTCPVRRIWHAVVIAASISIYGCTTYVYTEMPKPEIDPALRRIVLFNDTRYFLQESGIFNSSVRPGGRLSVNVSCYKRLEGIVDAYKIIGKNEHGEQILEWYGQHRYHVTTDGRNRVMRGLEVDDYVVIQENDFRPGRRSKLLVSEDPCTEGKLELDL